MIIGTILFSKVRWNALIVSLPRYYGELVYTSTTAIQKIVILGAFSFKVPKVKLKI
jgi:hypothetical protein